MNTLEKLQNKPREKRIPIESCIVDAAIFEEAEHDGEIDVMKQAANDLQTVVMALNKAKAVFNAARTYGDLRMAEKYIDAALLCVSSI